ncbi:MAG: periplasmic/7TM domain sensor diguanylate cyclase [Firmicutes bacterium]|nr:periplasmic/7TM domain sensor diguanylate cyclase [Bacillota bacterium]
MLEKINCRKMIVLLIFFVVNIFQAKMVSASEQGSYSVSSFQVLEDVDGSYSFSEVNSPEWTDKYADYPEEILSLGIKKSVYWVRFKFPQSAAGEPPDDYFLQLNNPNIDKIDLYMPMTDQGMGYKLTQIGVSRPTANKDITHNTWVFQLPHHFGQDKFIYLRLESTSALRLPVAFWQKEAFFRDSFLKHSGFGVIYGIIFAMLLFNLFIFFVLRDKVYLFYVLYMGSMFFYQFQVHGHLKMLIDIPYGLYNSIFWITLGAAFVFSVYFTREFLQVRDRTPGLDKILTGMVFLAGLQSILGVCGLNVWANHIAHGLGLLGPLFMMMLATIRFRQGFKPARYYLLAWGLLLTGVLLWSLSAYIDNPFPAINYLLVATAGESILLSFALADRVRILRLQKNELNERVEHYRDLSLTDELTGLYNKRYLYKRLAEELYVAAKKRNPLSFMVIDIDHFKFYNDNYGHWEGDKVLIKLGQIVRSLLKEPNIAFRYGGEEFTILLPNTSYNDALCVAESIREKLRMDSFYPTPDIEATVTVSIGLTEMNAGDDIESLFQRADDALYKAKKQGRNRTVVVA